MKNHRKKMIAPIVITALFLIYVIGYAVLLMTVTEYNPLVWLLAIPLAMLGAGMVCVLVSRIREIKGGEEDDLNNY